MPKPISAAPLIASSLRAPRTNAARARLTAEASSRYQIDAQQDLHAASSSVVASSGLPSGTNCGSSAT